MLYLFSINVHCVTFIYACDSLCLIFRSIHKPSLPKTYLYNFPLLPLSSSPPPSPGRSPLAIYSPWLAIW